MDNINLETKLKFNSTSLEINSLNLNDGSNLIYTSQEIIILNKNLSFQKVFPFNNIENNNIKFIRYINKGKFLFFNNNNLYIFIVKEKMITYKKYKFEEEQNLMDLIVLKNGMIIAISNQHILNIKLANNKCEIIKLIKIPQKYIFKEKKRNTNL